MRLFLTALILLPVPGLAQDRPVFSPTATEACLAAGGTDCPGSSADACMEATPGGSSTFGMNACIDAERAWWDGRLNRAYSALSKIEKAKTDTPGLFTALRDMQRAWIAWRDARCAYAAAQWAGGSGAGTAALSCQLRETADQAMALESRLEEARSR